MTTLIIRKSLGGKISGRCDSRCYQAKGFICKCVCAGMNHGKGFGQASRNTSLNAEIMRNAEAAADLLFPHTQYPLFAPSSQSMPLRDPEIHHTKGQAFSLIHHTKEGQPITKTIKVNKTGEVLKP